MPNRNLEVDERHYSVHVPDALPLNLSDTQKNPDATPTYTHPSAPSRLPRRRERLPWAHSRDSPELRSRQSLSQLQRMRHWGACGCGGCGVGDAQDLYDKAPDIRFEHQRAQRSALFPRQKQHRQGCAFPCQQRLREGRGRGGREAAQPAEDDRFAGAARSMRAALAIEQASQGTRPACGRRRAGTRSCPRSSCR